MQTIAVKLCHDISTPPWCEHAPEIPVEGDFQTSAHLILGNKERAITVIKTKNINEAAIGYFARKLI
ncbi:MAG: hypothetical protein OQK24_06515 [Magnetovibrio sp.]|nr:hypothetical protein [Magnetovibrio sp.]